MGLVTFGSVPHFGAVYALRKLGLQPGADVTLVQVAGNPEVLAALQALGGTIDVERMRAMNVAVDRDGKTPAAVAEEFLAR